MWDFRRTNFLVGVGESEGIPMARYLFPHQGWRGPDPGPGRLGAGDRGGRPLASFEVGQGAVGRRNQIGQVVGR